MSTPIEPSSAPPPPPDKQVAAASSPSMPDPLALDEMEKEIERKILQESRPTLIGKKEFQWDKLISTLAGWWDNLIWSLYGEDVARAQRQEEQRQRDRQANKQKLSKNNNRTPPNPNP